MNTLAHTHEAYGNKLALLVVIVCSMLGVLMQTLDNTIANVSLPYMQGNLAASRDQISWVLTSYIVAAAIMTAPVGWFSARFGKKRVFIGALLGFTGASMLCGLAETLPQIVVFRLMQGMFGAALGPLSQAVMYDLYPPDSPKRAKIMAVWGMGIMLGPIMGPTVGGFLTEYYSWRWDFFVNVPFGLIAAGGLYLCFKDNRHDRSLRFDWLGFSVLSLGVGAFQLMLDRGTDRDWFSSSEIIAECVLAGLGVYLFLVHMLTAKNPFIPRALFADRNYVASLALMYLVSMVLLASVALMPPFLQNMAGYPVLSAGLMLGPRGFGTILAMILVGRIYNRVDPRTVLAIGVAAMAWSLWEMAQWTPSIAIAPFLTVSIIQGFGMGFVFAPLNLTAFSTLSADIRTSGTSIMNLMRNLGSAVGVSVTTVLLSNSMQAAYNTLTVYASHFNHALDINAGALFMNVALPTGQASLAGKISARAATIAYQNDFLFLFYISLLCFPVIWLLRRPEFAKKTSPQEAMPEPAE